MSPASTPSSTTPLLHLPQHQITNNAKRFLSPRLISLITSTLTAINCSTPYIYSVYAPQLATKCQLNSSDAAKLSILLSCGSTFGGVPAGLFIDHFGPQVSSFLGSILGSGSFILLWYCYKCSWHSISVIGSALALSSFASIICFFSSIKCVTANFPHHRGTAGAFPVSGYALGSLWYSWIAKWIAHQWADSETRDGTALLLIFVAVCTGVCCALGSIGMKIHLKHDHDQGNEQHTVTVPGQAVKLHRSDSVSSQLMDLFTTRRRSFTKYAMSYWGANRTPSMDSFRSYQSLNQNTNTFPSQSQQTTLSRPVKIASVLSSSSPVFSIGSPMAPTAIAANRRGSVTKLGTLSSSLSQSRMNSYLQHQNTTNSAISTEDEECVDFYTNGAFSPNSNSSSSTPKLQSQQQIRASTPPLLPMSPHLNNQTIGTHKLPRISNDMAPLMDEEMYVAVEDTPIFVRSTDPLFPSTLSSSIFSISFMKHFIIVSFLISSGQFYIYNVGFVVVTLVQSAFITSGSGTSLKDQIASAQSFQVSLISLFSFIGRLLSGPISDLISRKFHLQRLWGIVFGSVVISMGHYLIGNAVSTVQELSLASVLIGFAFGFVFGTYPAIIADEFGTKLFTSLWGLVTTGGIFILTVWNSAFAQEVQAHIPSDGGENVCLQGASCFRETFKWLAGVGYGVTCFVLLVIWIKHGNKKTSTVTRT